MLTQREVFDKVKAHLLQQGCRSVKYIDSLREICRYRAPDGKMCAIGCLIKDEYYSEDLEGHATTHHLVEQALQDSGINVEDGREGMSMKIMLLDLQVIHDMYRPDNWAEQLDSLELTYFGGV